MGALLPSASAPGLEPRVAAGVVGGFCQRLGNHSWAR